MIQHLEPAGIHPCTPHYEGVFRIESFNPLFASSLLFDGSSAGLRFFVTLDVADKAVSL